MNEEALLDKNRMHKKLKQIKTAEICLEYLITHTKLIFCKYTTLTLITYKSQIKLTLTHSLTDTAFFPIDPRTMRSPFKCSM